MIPVKGNKSLILPRALFEKGAKYTVVCTKCAS